MDEKEALFWTMFRNFEDVALERYEHTAQELASPAKREFVRELHDVAPSDEPLAQSELAEAVRALLALGKGKDRKATLIIQGLILERLGEVIYRAISENEHFSAKTRELAARGKALSEEIVRTAPRLVSEGYGTGDPLFLQFAATSKPILSQLDVLGEGIDRVFSERFQMKFSEVLGKFGADLIQTCLALGINRRKLMCHMTGALMGL